MIVLTTVVIGLILGGIWFVLPQSVKDMVIQSSITTFTKGKTNLNITVQEYDENKSHYTLIDVRQPEEIETASVEPSIKIPMNDMQHRLNELDKSKHYVVMCRSGGRSLVITHFLHGQGFDVKNLQGGIDAYSREIDNSIPRY
jgi:rhodanese-related sulfurtransferase